MVPTIMSKLPACTCRVGARVGATVAGPGVVGAGVGAVGAEVGAADGDVIGAGLGAVGALDGAREAVGEPGLERPQNARPSGVSGASW